MVKYRTKVLLPDWLKVHKKSPGVPTLGGMSIRHGHAREAREEEEACQLSHKATGEYLGA